MDILRLHGTSYGFHAGMALNRECDVVSWGADVITNKINTMNNWLYIGQAAHKRIGLAAHQFELPCFVYVFSAQRVLNSLELFWL